MRVFETIEWNLLLVGQPKKIIVKEIMFILNTHYILYKAYYVLIKLGKGVYFKQLRMFSLFFRNRYV